MTLHLLLFLLELKIEYSLREIEKSIDNQRMYDK